MNVRGPTTRRWLIGAVAAVAAAATAVRELPFVLRHHYRRTPYDDLLSRLGDRDASVAFGRVANKNMPGATTAVAALLRRRLGQASLRSVLSRELTQEQVLVAGGWVIPQSLALICALAARES